MESLVPGAALLLDAGGGLQCANQQACELFDCVDEAALLVQWPRIAGSFGLAPDAMPHSSVPVMHAVGPADGAGTLTLELRVLAADAGGGYFALPGNKGMLDPLERELLLASEQRAWTYQRETLMHDLKGILNAMQISLELISDPDTGAALSAAEERKQRRMVSLKQDLLRVDRALKMLPGAEGHAEPPVTQVDLCELLKEVFTALRQLVRRNHVSLTLDLPEIPVLAKGRRTWIRQALFNIAVHRLNAMRAGGPLAVQAATTDQGAVVRFHDGVPHGGEEFLEESRRAHAAAQKNRASSDLRVARAIVESSGGALESGAPESPGAAPGTTIIVRLPH